MTNKKAAKKAVGTTLATKAGLNKVERKVDKVERRLDNVERKVERVEKKLELTEKRLDQKIDDVKSELMLEIRRNGVMMEHLNDKLDFAMEAIISNQQVIKRNQERIESSKIDLLPSLFEVVSDHSARIKKLEAAK